MIYATYKQSELFKEIENSNYDESEYDELRLALETEDAHTLDGNTAVRFALKHLCRLYPNYGVSHYKVTGVSHADPEDIIEHVVDATHDEKAKFYFHTKYPHTKYRVTTVGRI